MAFLNKCVWNASGTSSSAFVVGSALAGCYIPSGCLDPAVVDTASYSYSATDAAGNHQEGVGTYSVGSSTLTSTVIRNSSNAGAAVTFTSPPVVIMGGPISTDLLIPAIGNQTWFVAPYGSDLNSGLSSGTGTTNATTSTASPTLHFASVPTFIVANMMVWDNTTFEYIGEVLSTGTGIVTLTANAASAVGSGDVLAFATPLLTIGHAKSIAASYNWNIIYEPMILVANGAYTGVQETLPALFNCAGGGYHHRQHHDADQRDRGGQRHRIHFHRGLVQRMDLLRLQLCRDLWRLRCEVVRHPELERHQHRRCPHTVGLQRGAGWADIHVKRTLTRWEPQYGTASTLGVSLMLRVVASPLSTA